MITFDDVTRENIKEQNPNWPNIPDHPCIIFIIIVSGAELVNALLKPDIDKIYLYAKDPLLMQQNINC